MREKLDKFLDWVLDNPWLITVMFVTALGIVQVVVDTSGEPVELHISIDKRMRR